MKQTPWWTLIYYYVILVPCCSNISHKLVKVKLSGLKSEPSGRGCGGGRGRTRSTGSSCSRRRLPHKQVGRDRLPLVIFDRPSEVTVISYQNRSGVIRVKTLARRERSSEFVRGRRKRGVKSGNSSQSISEDDREFISEESVTGRIHHHTDSCRRCQEQARRGEDEEG